jgi:GTP-binding protein HflX
MIELAEPREKVVLVGAPLKSLSPRIAEEHLEELRRLVDTAGADVVGTLMQRIESPSPKFFLGEGKTEELRAQVKESGATLVVFD